MSMLDTFLSLPRPSAQGRYSVEATGARYRVARSFDDHAAVLISFPAEVGGASVPRRLANLSYAPPAIIEISGAADGRTRSERLAILECQTPDTELAGYFFRVVAAALIDEARPIDEPAFEAALDAVVSLFRALGRPGARTIEGLWAELAIIAWSRDATAALSSWHSSPRALHDFSAGSYRLEVKATLGALREHNFRLEQLSTLAPGVTLVASLLLEESADGDSILDLMERIATRVGGGEPARRLEAVVIASLGAAWRDAERLSFDVASARESLRVYDAEGIPSIPQPIPPEIKDVRFVVDLSPVRTLSYEAARALAPFFCDVLPTDDE